MANPARPQRVIAHRFKACAVALCLLGFGAAAQAPLDIRVALVIGNSSYAVAPLPNPVNDARAMANTLKQLGFSVMELENASRTQIGDAVTKLRDSLKGKQAVGMLYYAGHGVQVDWRNYMVPVEARLDSAADVPAQAVDIKSVIDAFREAGNRINIVVLDACRDNPFGAIASGKGLAQLDAPPGTFLAFATAPGNVAQDGDAKTGHGLYTQFLLEELNKPAAKIEDVFKRVRLNVRKQSQGQQIPWESTSLEDDFFFDARHVNATMGAADAGRDTVEWDRAKADNSAGAYAGYLTQFPSGLYAELAQARLDRLQKPAVLPQFKTGDALANDTTTERFRVGDMYEYRVQSKLGDTAPQRQRNVVTEIHDDVVEMNSGKRTFDRLGNIQTRRDKHWQDAQFFPAEYKVGKRWNLRAGIETDQRGDMVSLEAKVVGREQVRVAAGDFDTFRVEVKGTGQQGHHYQWTFWMNPRYGMPVRWIEQRANPRGRPGKLDEYELTALRAKRD